MRLFHFSDNSSIAVFAPRPVRIPAERPAGQEWLNGPLVWAIDDWHSMLYLFPRDCPRILIWPTDATTDGDRARWMGVTEARAVAYIEAGWLARLRSATIWRYALPPDGFEPIGDVGMWVARQAVVPARVDALSGLDDHLAESRVELRVMDDLTPLRAVWSSTLHASGVRLRNALGWGAPGWPHSTKTPSGA